MFTFLTIPQEDTLNAPQVVLGGFWMTPQQQNLVAVTFWICTGLSGLSIF